MKKAKEQRNNSTFWAMTFCRDGRVEKDDPKFEALSEADKAKLSEARAAWIEAVRTYAHCTDAYKAEGAEALVSVFDKAGFGRVKMG